MLQKRMLTPLAISAGILVLLSQFQNCASLPSEAKASEKPPQFFGFSKSQVEVYDEAGSVSLTGRCDRVNEGATLQWSLLNNDKSPSAMDGGETACVNGEFHFTVTMKDDMICGLDHVVRVQSPFGNHVESSVIKRCQPLASQKLPGQCELEYNIKNEDTGGRICEKVCYSSNVLVNSELRLESDCASLASTLAGQ